jgi:hypothetical protein
MGWITLSVRGVKEVRAGSKDFDQETRLGISLILVLM